MIPGLEPISVGSLPFAVIALCMITLAWSKQKHLFLAGLAVASGLMALSWLSFFDLLALSLFVLPPYLIIRMMWGNTRFETSLVAMGMVIWEVALFIYLRKYEWVSGVEWLDHPFSIVGLSYILFRVIHLIMEAPGLGHHPFNLLYFGTYTLAFWTFLSGPIQRYEAFIQGLEKVGRPATEQILNGGHRAVNGLIKAFLIAPVFLQVSDLQSLTKDGAGLLDLGVVLYSYTIYLYLSFSGYTDLMIAIARLCGVTTLPENFNHPYLARNVQDFWSRWHISLGTWIRHYVFTPLLKQLLTASPPGAHNLMLAVAVIITFLIVGAWHGTSVNFLIFGFLHGSAIVITGLYGRILKSILGKKRKKAFEAHPATRLISIIVCFHFIVLSMVFIPNSTSDVVNVLTQFLMAQG